MNLCFIICAVCGMSILVCQMIVSMLGLGERVTFPDDDDDAATLNDDFSQQAANPLPLASQASVRRELLPQSSPSMVRIGATGLAIAFFGLMGCAAEATQLEPLSIFGAALFSAAVAYFLGLFLLSQTAIRPFDESDLTHENHVPAIGTSEDPDVWHSDSTVMN